MGFKVNYRGLEVVCETPTDVDALARHLHEQESGSRRRSLNADDTVTTVAGLVRQVGQKQRTLLKEIMLASGTATDERLRQALQLEGNKALAGVLAGISRSAQKHNVDAGLIITKEVRDVEGVRTYFYSIPKDSMEEVRRGLKMGEVSK